jgi:phospholipase/carboxylesterase
MTAKLTGPARAAASGTATSLVVFLHGYGADGEDLIGLAEPLAPHMPDTRFAAPNAPDRCVNNPMGFQWFPIPWLDGSSEAESAVAAGRSFALLDAWLDAAGEGLAAERIALVGFSQGTMMALQVGLRRRAALAGIVGFSGRPTRWWAPGWRPTPMSRRGSGIPSPRTGSASRSASCARSSATTPRRHDCLKDAR